LTDADTYTGESAQGKIIEIPTIMMEEMEK